MLKRVGIKKTNLTGYFISNKNKNRIYEVKKKWQRKKKKRKREKNKKSKKKKREKIIKKERMKNR